MTRIIAGTLGGRTLRTPPGSGTRPTSDRVREALFSALDARGAVAGARVLDLYAGSGALGLEAASRGAQAVLLVESDRRAAEVIAQGLTDMRGTTAPRLHLELMCARVLLPGADVDERGVHARLDRLERRLQMLPGADGHAGDEVRDGVHV